jgi:hypothetical protein
VVVKADRDSHGVLARVAVVFRGLRRRGLVGVTTGQVPG